MLTDTKMKQARAANKAVKLTDGGELYLEVLPSGGKHWRSSRQSLTQTSFFGFLPP